MCGDDLRYEFVGSGDPPASAACMLEELQHHGAEAEEYIRYLTDPRPDLEEDSVLWQRVLEAARWQSTEVFMVLHGFRCEGTRLQMTARGLRMVPRIHAGETPRPSGFDSPEEYRETRQEWLVPLTPAIIGLFRDVENELWQAPRSCRSVI